MDCRCPRKLKDYPKDPCPEGRKAIDLARQGKVGGCPYFVADAEADFCFFKLMKDSGDHAVPTHRIARLLLIDDNDVKRVIQAFRRKIAGLFGHDSLEDFFDS